MHGFNSTEKKGNIKNQVTALNYTEYCYSSITACWRAAYWWVLSLLPFHLRADRNSMDSIGKKDRDT